MAIKNYTTSVSEEKTVGEIMALLAAKGATYITIDYDQQTRPNGVSFVIHIKGADGLLVPVPFKLPCNFQGVFRSLLNGYRDRTHRNRFERNPESIKHSRRVAWRIIKDWVAAQIALIEAEQATLAQVFLPYAVQEERAGVPFTMFDKFLEHVTRQKALNSENPASEVPVG